MNVKHNKHEEKMYFHMKVALAVTLSNMQLIPPHNQTLSQYTCKRSVKAKIIHLCQQHVGVRNTCVRCQQLP